MHLFRRRDQHPDPVTVNGLFRNMPRYRSFDDLSMDAFIEEMDEAGIDVGVVAGRVAPPPYNGVSNDDVASVVSEYSGRFVGFGAVDVTDPATSVEEVERLAERGFKGIAFDNPWTIPPRYDDDETIFPIYAKCSELGMIGMFTSSIYVGPDMSYCEPIHIQRVGLEFPDLRIVISHAAWPWTTQACGVAHQNPNVYLLPDFYLNIPNTPGADEYVRAANYYLGYRLLYGSGYPVRPLGDSIDNFRRLPFETQDILDRSLGENAARLLGIG
jgi:predicted TIM-barrel fold metal-dependent hydrolase